MSKRINSRTKGVAGEREFAQLVRDATGWILVRNLEQTRAGGYDLITVPDCPLFRYGIEIKRRRAISPAMLGGWWEQTIRQAIVASKIPLLCYRADRGKWRVMLPLQHLSGKSFHRDSVCEMALEDFIQNLVAETDGDG